MKRILFIVIFLLNLNFAFSQKVLNDIVISKIDSISAQFDSIAKTLNSLQHEQLSNRDDFGKLKDKLSNIEKSITDVKQEIEESKRGVFQEFIYPIILSIIAAIIFWIAFSYLPERSRKRKIRYKIEHEIYQVYTKLFSLFDTIMSFNNHSPSDYQSEIRGNKLKPRDIEIGLQNKCLNEHYFYDKAIKGKLLPIGKTLANNTKKIDDSIGRIFDFNIYLTSDEILHLEEIRKKLHVYDLENYNKEAVSKIGSVEFYPVNPSISYMKINFWEIYELYKTLQDTVFKYSLENREIQIYLIQHFYYTGEYEKAIKAIEVVRSKYPKDKNLFTSYEINALFKLNKKESAYNKIEKMFETKPHLVSNRTFISELLTDREILELLNKYFLDSEIQELQAVLKREKLQKEAFVKNAKELENYYKKKSKSVHNIG
ncbi:hypothetical protein [uncultured Algoriphagus sp.]|uniref:hypothetical protein n=1 Tax=uncultured Algoriphagus sp. TaxID=417365 RepID=UPI0030EE59A9